MNAREMNFLHLYFEMLDENIEEISEQLLETGINSAASRNRVLDLIKQQKAEIKIEKGKILKTKVLELIKKSDVVKESEADEKVYAIAARKLGKLESDDIISIKKDSVLLKDIGKLIQGDADDTGKTSR